MTEEKENWNNELREKISKDYDKWVEDTQLSSIEEPIPKDILFKLKIILKDLKDHANSFSDDEEYKLENCVLSYNHIKEIFEEHFGEVFD